MMMMMIGAARRAGDYDKVAPIRRFALLLCNIRHGLVVVVVLVPADELFGAKCGPRVASAACIPLQHQQESHGTRHETQTNAKTRASD